MAAQIFGSAATVLDLNIALFGLVPSNSVFTNQLGVVGANNANLVAYANQITNANFAGTSNSALATVVLNNLLGTDPANNADLQAAVTALLAANPANRGVVVYQLATILSQKEGDATFGAAATKFNTSVLNGYNYSNDVTSTVASPANPNAVPVIGKTFVLTAGVDAPVGTSADDVFVGTEATLSSADILTGGGGNDTLRFASSGGTAVNKAGFSTTGIATALVTSDAVGGTNFDVTGMVGTTNLINDNSSTDVIFNGAANIMSAKLQNVSGGNTQFIYQSSAIAGTSDVMNIALSNNKTIAGGTIGTVTANGIESFVVTTSGGSSVIQELASAGTLKNITISGDQNLTLGAANFSNTVAANTVNASALTGSLNLTLSNDGAANIAVAVTGGSANDRVSFTTFDKGDSFTGGNGIDTIALTNAVATGSPAGTLSGVETLEDTGASVGTINMSNFAGVTNVFLSAGLGGATVVSNAATGLTETVNVGTNAAADLTTTLKTDGAADSITLQLNKIATASNLGNVVTTGFETVNLNTVLDSAVNGTGNVSIAAFNDTSVTTLNVNAATNLTLTAASTGNLTKLDASASTGNLDLSKLTYSSAGATIKGGAGKDSLTAGTGADTITLGGGADTLTYTAVNQSNDKMDIVTDFTSGTDVLDLTGLGLVSSAQFLGARTSFGLAQGALIAGGNISAVLDSSTNILWVDANGDGTLDNRDFRITLQGVTALTAADLNLVSSGNTITVNTTGAVLSTTSKTNASAFTTVQGDNISTKAAYLANPATISGGLGTDTVTITDSIAATNLSTVFASNDIEALVLAAGSTGAVQGGTNLTSFSNTSATAASTVLLPATTGASFTSTSSGVDTVTLGGTNQSVSTGDGADVVNAANATLTGASVNLGAGTGDTFNITDASTSSWASGKLTGVEIVNLTGQSSLTTVSDQSFTVNGGAATTTLAVTGNTVTFVSGAAQNSTLSGTANYVVSGQTTGQITSTATGTLGVTTTDNNTFVTSASATTINAAANTNTTVNVGGAGAFTVTGVTGTTAVTQAAGETGTLAVTLASTTTNNAITQVTGGGALTVNGGTLTTGVTTIANVAGNSASITLGTALAGGGVTHTGAGALTITLGNQAGASLITGSVTGLDTITLGSTGGGSDVIVGTGGTSNINAIDTVSNFLATGTDTFKTGTTATTLNLLTIATAEPATLAAAIQTAASGAGAALAANTQAFLITINGGSLAGTYAFQNIGGSLTTVDATDFFIKLTGTTGSIIATTFTN